MNLLIRFFLLWLFSGQTQHSQSDTVRQSYRIQPHDMGWRNHLPNFRFLSFMELGRFQFWRGLKSELKRPAGMRLIAAQDMVYIRPVGFLARLDMETTLLGWDKKYVYFRHDFYVGKKLVAIGIVKEACVAKGSVLSPDDIFSGESPQTAAGIVESWQQFQAEVRSASGPR